MRQLSLGCLFLALLLLSACAINPVTGQREITLMSEAQELQLGASSDESIVAQYGLTDDEALAAYVRNIGQTMVPVSHRPTLRFEFRLLDDPIVNAFALPGGYVYITRGILAYLDSEAALAGVIGHEIGHITARHGVKRYTKQTILGVGLGVGSILSEGFAQYAGLASNAGQLLLLKYGRDDERQSDRLGVEYATKIGYSTHDMAEFFRTLKRMSPPDGRLPSWMSTHPDPGERTETVHALTGEWQAKVAPPATGFREDRDQFLRKIDGLVFGPDPRQGFVSDGIFYHPQLRFRFPVPTGWTLQNGRSQVVMVSKDQDAAVIFQAVVGATTPREAADAFVAESKGTVLDRNEVLVAGAKARRTKLRLSSEEGSMLVLSTFFEFGGQIWVFHGLASETSYAQRQNELRRPADGFARETDSAVLATAPIRLKVVEAPNGDFNTILDRWPIPDGAQLPSRDAAGLALLNGMQAADRVSAGQLVKVLVQAK
jgi:predicted Zn-dependent protease